MQQTSFFAERIAVLATMHRKETAIAPVLEHELGVTVSVPDAFDTDRFGTFTRDIQRPANQVETAILKAKAALELTGETLAIASEGSFAPHPALPYLPCNHEIVVLIDQQNDLQLVGEATSIETNFNHATVTSLTEAEAFAQRARFPSHGLIVMPEAKTADSSQIIKGITDKVYFIEVVTSMLKDCDHAHVETDMRAMYNPSRMKVIQQATQDLAKKAKQHCPQCHLPGFDIVEYTKGLPCALCHSPTDQILAATYHCQKCNFKQQKLFPFQKEADPAQCQYCNP